jgi:hypothetical protein
MPLIRYTKLPTKLPPPPEFGEKSLWQYIPRQSKQRILFLLIALGVVIFLKSSGSASFGGLFGPPEGQGAAHARAADPGVFHLEVTGPTAKSPR